MTMLSFFLPLLLKLHLTQTPLALANCATFQPLQALSEWAFLLPQAMPVQASLPPQAMPVQASLLPQAPAIVLAVLLFIAAIFFAFRYFTLKHALRDTYRDLSEIRQDLSRNQILHLPLPDRDLERLTQSVNAALEEIRQERLSYEKREAEFQKLIENISHDLRTPLTVILGYLKWMKKTAPNVPEQDSLSEFLDILERNARSMEKLATQFYEFSRLNARDYALELSRVDVCRILKESIASHYQVLADAHLNLDSRLPEHPVMVQGNANALERIFSNLFQNAGRYARSALMICLEEPGDGQVRVSFRNDSEPVTEDEISHLFDRFYRNDNARHQSGSGLGLTVAKSLAELMGGTLGAASACPGPPETEKNLAVICFTLTLNGGG